MQNDYDRIFLLSHMRAFTSLAGHILGSHPHINGYFEMHISYEDRASLDRQRSVLEDVEGLKPGSRHIFDKLLHNDYKLRHERIGLTGCKVLVSLLEPTQTIKSIVDLFMRKETEELYASPAAATAYYIERIRTLAEFCRGGSITYYYYDAEMFQAAPETLLPALTGWLELDPPLSERYQVFSQTGMAGKGDSSKFIHSGKIDRTPMDYSHITVAPELLDQAGEAYRECRGEIITNARDTVLKHPA